MFRVIGVETGDHPRREFVVIRNQSLRYENLHGWAVTDESYFYAAIHTLAERLYIFRDDLMVEPGAYVALCTGVGEKPLDTRWRRSQCVRGLLGQGTMHLARQPAGDVDTGGTCGPFYGNAQAVADSRVENMRSWFVRICPVFHTLAPHNELFPLSLHPTDGTTRARWATCVARHPATDTSSHTAKKTSSGSSRSCCVATAAR